MEDVPQPQTIMGVLPWKVGDEVLHQKVMDDHPAKPLGTCP
jgi:hypothetical protein